MRVKAPPNQAVFVASFLCFISPPFRRHSVGKLAATDPAQADFPQAWTRPTSPRRPNNECRPLPDSSEPLRYRE